MVQKTRKPRGRPRHFDEDDALDRAMRVFWAKGYDGATIDDLVAGTGVGRPSLYATFGDKETLFLRCLENYGQKVGALALRALDAAPNIHSAIHGFLRQAIESATCADSPRGCLMACIVPSVDDAKVREISARAMAHAQTAIEQRLEEAVAADELPPCFPCALRSRQILDMMTALMIRARLGATRETLIADAEAGATLLFGLERAPHPESL